MVNKFNFKILVVGRLNCGLEELYGDKIEVVGFLPYHEFQQKLRQSRYLFVPNVYDASPRVVTEALSKDIPVLMNKNIVCGSKYINDQTGELFTDENDVEERIASLVKRDMHPREWWQQNYSRSASGKKFRNFLSEVYPDVPEIQNASEIQFH
jgi:glycosyltransferase involved in cell wall biosynthesis